MSDKTKTHVPNRAKTHVPDHATDELAYPHLGKRKTKTHIPKHDPNNYQCEHCLMIFNSKHRGFDPKHRRDEHQKVCLDRPEEIAVALKEPLSDVKEIARQLPAEVLLEWVEQRLYTDKGTLVKFVGVINELYEGSFEIQICGLCKHLGNINGAQACLFDHSSRCGSEPCSWSKFEVAKEMEEE